MKIINFKNNVTMGTIICVYSKNKREFYRLIGKETNIKTNKFKIYDINFDLIGKQNNDENKYFL